MTEPIRPSQEDDYDNRLMYEPPDELSPLPSMHSDATIEVEYEDDVRLPAALKETGKEAVARLRETLLHGEARAS